MKDLAITSLRAIILQSGHFTLGRRLFGSSKETREADISEEVGEENVGEDVSHELNCRSVTADKFRMTISWLVPP